jgi:hypothetical protein
MHGVKRAILRAGFFSRVFLAVAMVFLPAVAQARDQDDAELRAMLQKWLENNTAASPPPCEKDCFVLSTLTLGGAVGGPMSFRLTGSTLVEGPTKVPLFGPSGQVRLEDLSLNGAPPTLGFEDEHYFCIIAGARSFTLTGRMTLGDDEMLTVIGPLVSLDARLSQGRIIEGARQSGLSGATIHFDPMTPESQSEAESRTPKVFRLSRAVRIGKETGFVYRLVMSQGTDIGTVRLPLVYGEKVQEVSGSRGWTSSGGALLLPTTGKEADVTITGVLGEAPDGTSAAQPRGGQHQEGPRSFVAEERSAYEWWLVESDPEYSVEMGGDAKLVDNSKSPIPPTLPTARTFLVQRGQRLEVTSTSLARGEVLAAVARTMRRFVSVTARGEVIGDETIQYDNNGLDHLTFTPSGQPMYLSTDGQAGRILHLAAGSPQMLVPLQLGAHQLRVQTLSETGLWPLLGVVTVPMSDYPLTTSAIEVTVGLPPDIHPVAVIGGDRARWIFAQGQVLAALFGAAVACFAFRTRKTRVLGSLVTVGLLFVSPTVFFVATAGLFFAGAVFLASRFLRGNLLLAASAAALIVSMFGARWALSGDLTDDTGPGLFVQSPSLPVPESSRPVTAMADSIDTRAGITPISLSMPTSERYVQTSRQLVTSKRPFTPRILYTTQTFLVGLELAWLAIIVLLVHAHKEKLVVLLGSVKARLARRPETPAVDVEFPPC